MAQGSFPEHCISPPPSAQRLLAHVFAAVNIKPLQLAFTQTSLLGVELQRLKSLQTSVEHRLPSSQSPASAQQVPPIQQKPLAQ
jgi:hypothetical protein